MTNTITRNTKEFQAIILKSERIVLITHSHPDGDALGSTVGLATFLETIGKKPEIIVPDRWGETLGFIFLDGREKEVTIFNEEQEKAEYIISQADLMICLDMSGFSRTEGMSGYLAGARCTKVLIDHHKKPETECFDLWFSETEISSASELVYQILMKMPQTEGKAGSLTKEGGRALLTGMTTDTNNFNNSTYPSTFKMASDLIAAGIDRDEILLHINNEHKETRLRLMGELLRNEMKITPEGVAYMVLSGSMKEEFSVEEGDTEGFVNIPLAIKQVKMSIFLKAENGKFRVSTRSKKGVSARLFNERFFFGGGHEQAAGGKLPYEIATTPEEAAAYTEKAIKIFFNEPDIK